MKRPKEKDFITPQTVNGFPKSIFDRKGYESAKNKYIDYLEAKINNVALVDAGLSLPTVENAGITAVEISEGVKPELTAQEQAFFVAGFQECVKYLELQSNEP